MPVLPILSDNGNCLTYKATGVVQALEFSRAREEFSSNPENIKKLTYVIVDYSDTLEVVRSLENIEHVRSIDKQREKGLPGVIIAVLSDQLMRHSYEDVWRRYAKDLGWKYGVFSSRESLEEWIFTNVSKQYDGFITKESLQKSRIASKWRGLEKLGFLLEPLVSYLNVSTALIMSYHDNAFSVLDSNLLKKNSPYKTGTHIKLNDNNSYFEYIINTGKELYIADATSDEQWKNNPSLDYGFISFIGLPIRQPTGEVFGIVCLLNESPIILDAKQREALLGTRVILETQLKLKFDNEKIHEHLREILDLQVSIEKESRTDYLTGFFNRKNFLEISENELNRSRRNNTALSFIFCDIDHFKNINDTFGHDAGDEVLKQFSSLLKNNIRAYDTVWRWGGEEFLIQLPETDSFKADEVANKLRTVVDNADFFSQQQHIHVTVSFGVSEIYLDENMNDFLARLDKLLYKAKHLGRNQVITAPKKNRLSTIGNNHSSSSSL